MNSTSRIALITITWILATFLVISSDYVPRENDSRFYSLVTQNLCKGNIAEFITPKWDGFASHYADKTSPFIRDHPAGQFIIPALLCKMGLNAEYSLLSTNILYKILIYLFIVFITLKLTGNPASWWGLLLIQIIPISLSYLLRSNHEQPLLLAHLITFSAFMNVKPRISFLLMSLGLILAVAIKGMIALPLFVTLVAVLLWQKRFTTIAGVIISLALFLGLYEIAFRSVSGQPFWPSYIDIQILGRSVDPNSNVFVNIIKGSWYYGVRLLTYTAPSLLLLIFIAIKKRPLSFKIFTSQRASLIFICLYIIFSVGFFSLSHRTASRYIYVSYYFFILLQFLIIFSQNITFKVHKTLIATTSSILLLILLGFKTYSERDNKEKYKIPYSTVEERDLLRKGKK